MSRPPLDPDTLAALLDSVGGDREFLAELFDTFTAEAPALLAAIEGGVAAGDAAALRHAAHTLKSTSASLGALPLSDLSKELEQAGRTGEIAAIAGRVQALRQLVEEAIAAMAAAAEGS